MFNHSLYNLVGLFVNGKRQNMFYEFFTAVLLLSPSFLINELCFDFCNLLFFIEFVLFLLCLCSSLHAPQLEKRGERRAEAEKLLAQAQEIGTVDVFQALFYNSNDLCL